MFMWLFIPAKRMLHPDFICCFQSPTHFFLLRSSVPPPLHISPSLFHFLPVSGSVPFTSFSQSWFSYFHTSPLFHRHPSLPTFTLLSPLNIDLLHSLVLLNLSGAMLSPCKLKTTKQTACKTSCPLSIRENIYRSIENSPHSQWNMSYCPPLVQFNPTCKTEKSSPWLGCATLRRQRHRSWHHLCMWTSVEITGCWSCCLHTFIQEFTNAYQICSKVFQNENGNNCLHIGWFVELYPLLKANITLLSLCA